MTGGDLVVISVDHVIH